MALSTSSSRDANLPAAPRLGEPQNIMIENIDVLDSDEDMMLVDERGSHTFPAIETDQVSADMVVFQVLHANPSRLKRPLSSHDDVTGHDIALRKYRVLERSQCDGDGGDAAQHFMRLRVEKCKAADACPYSSLILCV